MSGLTFNPPPWIRNGEKTSTSSARGFVRIRCSGFFADYIYTLDDGTQGSNNIGLRPTQWEVLDEDFPGTPGTPNVRLEFGGTTSEIEFAVSIEAAPDAADPLVVGAPPAARFEAAEDRDGLVEHDLRRRGLQEFLGVLRAPAQALRHEQLEPAPVVLLPGAPSRGSRNSRSRCGPYTRCWRAS